MIPIDVVTAVPVLVFAVSLGLVAHELAHALVLRAAGVPHDIEWLPGAEGGLLQAGLTGKWAAVEPRASADTPAWMLRVSAMMPLALIAPLALVPAGVLPDPFAAASLPVQFAVLGWMACAIPSPQDFSVLWYADSAVESTASETA